MMKSKFLLIAILMLAVFLIGCVEKPPEPPAPPTPVEGISCTDSLDCPKLMKCEDSVCVDIGCVEEGMTGPSAGINPEWLDHLSSECCPGLEAITYSGYFDDDCERTMLVGAPSIVCADCGDGSCSEGETKCNCPEDCE